MPWGKTEKEPCGYDKHQCDAHHAPCGIVNHPVDGIDKEGVFRTHVGIGKVFHAGDTEHLRDDKVDYRNHKERVYGRVAYSAVSVEVVSDKVSGAQYQLQQRTRQRA